MVAVIVAVGEPIWLWKKKTHVQLVSTVANIILIALYIMTMITMFQRLGV